MGGMTNLIRTEMMLRYVVKKLQSPLLVVLFQ